MQKEFKWGFVGEAAYVATRQIDQLGFLELNWSPIGGGQAGRQLNQKFGRTAQTRLVAPIGDTKYNAPPGAPGSPVREWRPARRQLHAVEVGGYRRIAGQRRRPAHHDSRVLLAEHRASARSIARTISTSRTSPSCRSVPVKPWLNDGGVTAAILGGWQVNNLLSFWSGLPFDITASGTSLNAPESSQRADQVKADVEILGGIGRGNAYFDPLAFKPVTEARFGTAPWSAVRGPGYANWDFGLFRQIRAAAQRRRADQI